MPKISDFVGVIFDVDDTLLDNKPRDLTQRLHERSRSQAIRTVGERYGITKLIELTPEQHLESFLTAPAHTMAASIWSTLRMVDLVRGDVIDHSHPLLLEITDLKNQLYERILIEEGEEVPGASQFVRDLAANGLEGKLAIASTAVRRDIFIFLDKMALTPLFPDKQIISLEHVTHPKPHPEAFDLAFKTLGLPNSARSKVLVFEDDPRGIAAAKAAGLHVFAITTAHDREVLAKCLTPPDHVADSYAEFAAHIGLPTSV